MRLSFSIITQRQAEEIAYNWKYEGIYAFYDMVADQDDLKEFLDPQQRQDLVYAAIQNDDLIGFLTTSPSQDGKSIEIGLGLKPDLTGKGMGVSFVEEGIAFIIRNYTPELITLAVAEFNQRAIKVYEKAGFKRGTSFQQATNGGYYRFGL
ncbi:GNAT family N-acetyltransferase [Radiobacillus sp. PE A8.2]|uniref:GNAT family N-acetyltransferase n=1 Tax=Radiobacillus sp. PE A8.2 TaxID=3380349 RepID=UPI003890AFD8